MQKLILESGFKEEKLKDIDNDIKLTVNEAAEFAVNSEFPNETELFKDVLID